MIKTTKYKIMQDINDWENPSGNYLVIDINNNIIAEFDFKKEAQIFVAELKNKLNNPQKNRL
jgi:hypothetical protein